MAGENITPLIKYKGRSSTGSIFSDSGKASPNTIKKQPTPVENKTINIFKIENEKYHTFYTPQKIKEYERLMSC